MAAYLTAERDCGACLCSKDFLRSGSIFKSSDRLIFACQNADF